MMQPPTDWFAYLGQVLAEDDWYPEIVSDLPTTYRCPVEATYERFMCYIRLIEERTLLVVYVVSPTRAPLEERSRVAEFLTRLNHTLLHGSLEMNWRDGQIRLRSSLDYGGLSLTAPLIERLLTTAVETMDALTNNLEAVIEGEQSPEEAVAEIVSEWGE